MLALCAGMNFTRRTAGQAGFSVLETLLVVSIMGVMASMAVLQVGNARPAIKGDSAMRTVIAQMRTARELAITQRRYMRLSFGDPNKVEILREEVPGPSTTSVGSTVIEGGIAYSVISGLPDTPDSFGLGSAVNFGTATNVKFTPDGTLVNQDGQTVNGTVLLSLSNQKQSARAITVLGSTGRIRGYRWDGSAWKLV